MEIGNYVPAGKEGCFNVSPSSLHSWFENKSIWGKSYIKKNRTFTANTNTVFGNICHAIFEAYSTNQILNDSDISDYLAKHQDNPDVDAWFVQDNWGDSQREIIKFMGTRPQTTKAESQVLFEVEEGYTIGGTYDAVTGTTLTDYKTCSAKPSKIKLEHLFQLATYAIALELNGEEVNTLEVVYVVKPNVKGKISEKTGKVIGIKQTVIQCLEEPFTDELRQMVKKHLKHLVATLKVHKEQPELYEFLFPENPLSFMQD